MLASKLHQRFKPMFQMRVLLVFDLVFEILSTLELFYDNKTKWGAETIALILTPYLIKLLITFGKWRKWKICSSLHSNTIYEEKMWHGTSLRYFILLLLTTEVKYWIDVYWNSEMKFDNKISHYFVYYNTFTLTLSVFNFITFTETFLTMIYSNSLLKAIQEPSYTIKNIPPFGYIKTNKKIFKILRGYLKKNILKIETNNNLNYRWNLMIYKTFLGSAPFVIFHSALILKTGQICKLNKLLN